MHDVRSRQRSPRESCAVRSRPRVMRAASGRVPLGSPVLVAALALLAGCETQPVTTASTHSLSGQVTGVPLEPGAAERYALEPGVRFDHAIAEPENETPAYPEQLLALRLEPVEIRVRLVVDAAGSVASVDPLETIDPARAAFLAAVQDALGGWRFAPLIRIEDVPGHTTVSYGDVSVRYAGRATALPFHQDYLFVFTQADGVPQVRGFD
jgi:hypothetical protein